MNPRQLELATTLPMLAAAVEYARHGFPVYPANPRAKSPLHRGWQRAATSKVERLVQTWERYPEANVGVICRDVVVLDAESHSGEDAVADLCLPATTTVRTGGGSHFYFVGKAPTRPRLLHEVELRGTKTGVLGAGSVHPNGSIYEWVIPPWEKPPVAIPDQLRELIGQPRALPDPLHGPIPKGRRNTTLTRFAGGLRGHYGISTALGPILQELNRHQCLPPLPEVEVAQIVRSAEGWEQPPDWIADPRRYTYGDPRLSLAARMVLGLLVTHARADGTCFPGIRRLCELSAMSPRRVIAAIYDLERFQRIEVLERSHRGSRYRLLPWADQTELFPPTTGSYVHPWETR